MALSKIEFDYTYYLDRTALFLGESGTGKSFIINDALFRVKPYINQGIVFSPTNDQNKIYDGIFPRPCIHKRPTEELLIAISQRQLARAKVYKKANKEEILQKLFLRIKDPKFVQVMKSLAKRKSDLISQIKSDDVKRGDKIESINKKCKSFVTAFYRAGIIKHLDKLKKIKGLSEDEQFTLEYINFNPRIILVFDDCTTDIKKLAKTQVMQEIFYQGRHMFITALFAIHSDKALLPEEKKNAFNIIFTAKEAASAYFRLASNDFNKQEQMRANAACAEAMSEEFQKLVWIREKKAFYKYKAPKHEPFRFGNDELWKYCAKIESDPDAIDETNEFMVDMLGN